MNANLKNEIVAALEVYLSEYNMSGNYFAQHAAIPTNYISRIRTGHDTVEAGNGKVVKIESKYYQKIADSIQFKLSKTYWNTVPTIQFQRILATLEDAKEFGYTNIIIGETGCGKTYTAKLFANKHPQDCFVINISQTDNISDIIDKILDAIKINCSAKSKTKRLVEVVKHMKKLRLGSFTPILILDESEYTKQPSLCAIKWLCDELKGVCAIVLMGTDQLSRNIEKLRKKDKDGIPQFCRRIKFGMRYLNSIDKTFKQFLNMLEITDKDIVQFLQKNCDNYGELHDVLVPVMRELDRTGEPLTVENIRTILNCPQL